jgi:putative protease
MAFWRFIKKIFRGLKGKKKPLKRKSGKPRLRKQKKVKTKNTPLRKAKRTVKRVSHKPPKKEKRFQPKKKIKAKTPAKSTQKGVGTVTHYFDRISVAVLKVSGPLKIGDSIRFSSRQGEFVQMVVSMQIDRKDILKASKGSEVGIKTLRPVEKGDKAFMVVEG